MKSEAGNQVIGRTCGGSAAQAHDTRSESEWTPDRRARLAASGPTMVFSADDSLLIEQRRVSSRSIGERPPSAPTCSEPTAWCSTGARSRPASSTCRSATSVRCTTRSPRPGSRHPGLPSLASGMIGSAQGWIEAPYADLPAGRRACGAQSGGGPERGTAHRAWDRAARPRARRDAGRGDPDLRRDGRGAEARRAGRRGPAGDAFQVGRGWRVAASRASPPT